jgi:hypothetical protein
MNTGVITATGGVTSGIIGGAVNGSKDISYQNAYTSGTVNSTGNYIGAHLGVWRGIVPDGNLFYLDNGTEYKDTKGATKVTAETLLIKDTFAELLADEAWIYANGPELKVFHKHTEEILPAVEPTYTETGLTEGEWCPRCGTVFVEQKIIPVIDKIIYAPTNVKATNDAATGYPKISWDAVDGAAKYQVWRSTSKDGTYGLMKTVAGTTLTNANAVAG